MLTRTIVLSAALLAIGITTASAASSLTARSSGVQAVKAGPGNYYATLDKLDDDERVRVAECTHKQRWCRIIQLDDGPSGWVEGSYLIGSGAKNAVTPFEFSFDPMDPMGLFSHP